MGRTREILQHKTCEGVVRNAYPMHNLRIVTSYIKYKKYISMQKHADLIPQTCFKRSKIWLTRGKVATNVKLLIYQTSLPTMSIVGFIWAFFKLP